LGPGTNESHLKVGGVPKKKSFKESKTKRREKKGVEKTAKKRPETGLQRKAREETKPVYTASPGTTVEEKDKPRVHKGGSQQNGPLR